jgi:hypothetical protein
LILFEFFLFLLEVFDIEIITESFTGDEIDVFLCLSELSNALSSIL